MKNLKESSLMKASSYLFFKIIAYVISILSIPILTKYFMPVKYGEISLIETTLALITSFFTLGIPQAYIRFYNKAEIENKVEIFDYSIYQLIKSIIIVCFVFTFVFYILQVGFEFKFSIILSIITSFMVGIQQFLSYIRARGFAYLHSLYNAPHCQDNFSAFLS